MKDAQPVLTRGNVGNSKGAVGGRGRKPGRVNDDDYRTHSRMNNAEDSHGSQQR